MSRPTLTALCMTCGTRRDLDEVIAAIRERRTRLAGER